MIGVIYVQVAVVCFVQEDIFQSVGVPLVRNALAGYNTSILSYGQVLLLFDVCCIVPTF